MLVLDIEDPSQPTVLGRYELNPGGTSAGELFAVELAGQYAFLSDEGRWSSTHNGYTGGGLHIVDLSDPAAPRRVSGINSGRVSGVAVAGSYAYLAAEQMGLLIADITDPTTPKVVGSASLEGFPAWDVLVSEDRAYVYGGSELFILDISNPRSPRLLARHFGQWTTLVSASGSSLLTVEQPPLWTLEIPAVRITDYSNPTQPLIINQYDVSHFQHEIGLTMARGERVHLYGKTSQGTVLQTLDISQQSHINPIASASFDLGGSAARDVRVSGQHAYLADQAGLRILDVSDPLRPRWVTEVLVAPPGDWQIGESSTRMIKTKEYLAGMIDDWEVRPIQSAWYKASRLHAWIHGSTGLRVVDISDPTNPISASHGH